MKTLSLLFIVCVISSTAFAAEDGMTSSNRAADISPPPATETIYSENETTEDTTPQEKPVITPPLSQANLLENELHRYQQLATQPFEMIPVTKLKYHSNNQIVLQLRNRLIATGDLLPENNSGTTLFDKNLKHAVEQFQTRHGLKSDGVVGNATIHELNVSPQERIQQLTVNIKRWQTLSGELPERYIMVNIPDFKFHLIEDGHEMLTMKAIVGKPDLPTPEITSRITRVVFNPFWNVPTKIAMNDIIPKAINDPYYLDDMHIKVYVTRGDSYKEVNHNDVNWERIQENDHNPYQLRQDPGDDNSLGLVKFEFPNQYDVYMHDTPVKSLFDQDDRALSHGCVRLERPMDLVTYLMKDNTDWDDQHTADTLASHKTTYVRLAHAIPVYITYVTVFADENGLVNYRNDIYNRDNEPENNKEANQNIN